MAAVSPAGPDPMTMTLRTRSVMRNGMRTIAKRFHRSNGTGRVPAEMAPARKGPRKLTHVSRKGDARMVDVGGRDVTRREAVARAIVDMRPATLALAVGGGAPKGDVLATARIAAIQAAKKTSDLIPL